MLTDRPLVGIIKVQKATGSRFSKGVEKMRIVKEHDERRNEIITIAEEFFLTKGFNKTTVNDILKRIGIAKGTFYHYFVSKEEVLDAVIGQIIDQEIMRAKEIQESDGTALEKLISFLAQNTSESTHKEEIVQKML